MSKDKSSSEKISKLDQIAKELGMGGNLSPEIDEKLYKKKMQQRKEIQYKRLKMGKAKQPRL